MLAVDTTVLCPRAGAMPGELVALKCNLVRAAWCSRACHKVAAALRIAWDHHQMPAGLLKLFDLDCAACRICNTSCIHNHTLYIHKALQTAPALPAPW